MKDILRTLRFSSLIFASKKNLRIAGKPAVRSFSEEWWA